jgi:hypothetical protein
LQPAAAADGEDEEEEDEEEEDGEEVVILIRQGAPAPQARGLVQPAACLVHKFVRPELVTDVGIGCFSG